jgi:ABC-type dipeptide/oligopeptide/nickel transport system permease subunit
MIIGLISGYWEGWLDRGLQRLMDAVMAIPGLILALAIVSVLTPGTTNAMLAIFPGLAISLAVLGFNLFGDTLRDAWDPKLRSRG